MRERPAPGLEELQEAARTRADHGDDSALQFIRAAAARWARRRARCQAVAHQQLVADELQGAVVAMVSTVRAASCSFKPGAGRSRIAASASASRVAFYQVAEEQFEVSSRISRATPGQASPRCGVAEASWLRHRCSYQPGNGCRRHSRWHSS